MPNWTSNKIYGRTKILKKFLDKNKNMDFNKIVEMPNSLNDNIDLAESEEIYKNITECLFAFLSRGTFDIKVFNNYLSLQLSKQEYDLLMSQHHYNKNDFNEDQIEKMMEIGKGIYTNKIRYGHFTWYSWRLNNWGTKWNACDSVYIEEDNENSTIYFETAWSEPSVIFEEICRKYPKEKFDFYWEYEEGGLGEGYNDNGKFISKIEY